jgi:hypothetical protein
VLVSGYVQSPPCCHQKKKGRYLWKLDLFFCEERDLLIDKEQFHVVYPRLRNRPRLGRWVRCKCHVPGRIYGVSRKERQCGPWEIKGLRKREKKDQELLCELP